MTRPARHRLAALALVAALVAGPAPAQPMAPAPAPSSVTAATVVSAARDLIRAHYILPDTAAALDAALAAAERQGKFAGLAGPALASAINAVMRSVTPDGHLFAGYDPARAADLAAGPPAAGGGAPMPSPAMARMIEQTNAGFRRFEVFPGNVRYIEHTGFAWGTPEAEAALAGAMEFLRGGSAIVIDERANGGGAADAVAAMASYFLPAGTPLMRFQTREGVVDEAVSKATPFTLAGKPVYVLTSKGTFSAGEEFAAHVAAFGFGTLIGETTGGGGFNNQFFALPGGHLISISNGQALHAKTGKGWEQTGIAPGIAVPADRALARARVEAIGALAAAASGPEQRSLAAMVPVMRALAEGTTAARPLATYAGRYGERIIEVGSDGALASRRAGGPAARLVALGGDEFAPESAPAQRFRFTVEGGTATALEVDTPGGPQRAPRIAG